MCRAFVAVFVCLACGLVFAASDSSSSDSMNYATQSRSERSAPHQADVGVWVGTCGRCGAKYNHNGSNPAVTSPIKTCNKNAGGRSCGGPVIWQRVK
jgi:hypothetical protein